jgi:hypothetical protein
MKITKELVYSLNDENITVKKQNEILSLIHKKVDDIWKYIITASERHLHWYSFSNDENAYSNSGNGSDGGRFSLEDYSEQIDLVGEFSQLSNHYYNYNEGFPSEYLWEDNWKEIVDNHIKDAICKQNKADLKRNNNLVKKGKKEAELMKSIKSKLTKEEFNFIKKKAI